MNHSPRIGVVGYTRIAVLTTVLALLVSSVGAYVRLSDAGLSCPDWPGCYGQLTVPSAADAAVFAFPDRPLDPARAWKEMIHRYLAGLLGLAILALAILAWRRRRLPGQLLSVPLVLLGLVILQALLGMWTVILLLEPAVVTGHLLGGLATTALLWWLSLRQGRLFLSGHGLFAEAGLRRMRPWVGLALVVVVSQLALGGWTSANYAALACPDLPLCQGQLLPPLDFDRAFVLWPQAAGNFEGGVLDNDARVTIHLMHRVGAVVTLLLVGAVAVAVMRTTSNAAAVRAAAVMLAVLVGQVLLGVANVLLGLPIEVAVAHNSVAGLLMLSVITVYHMTLPPEMSM